MSENVAELMCPRCGAMLNSSVASGICPACLLKQVAMGTGTDSFPAMPWTPPSVAELASAFPQLEVLELIGHGGMGAVYKARQKSLGRLVALKILAPQHAANPDFAERFEREAKALAEVSHPNIVTVHDFGRAGEFYFLTMEFVDGVNLRQAMTAGRLTPPQALAIVPPICEALQFAHDRGIVHRDIKPENLLLDKDGRIKIADFGIARMLRGGDARQSLGSDEIALKTTEENRAKETDITQESVLGTPSYMAPEQRDRPASVDHRADIFSLGVVLYEMLTGELPGSKLQPPSRKVEIDVRLDEIVLRALEKQPELRFQTASDFRTHVTTFVSGESISDLNPTTICQPMIARGMVSTPEKLATLWGIFVAGRNSGEFVLDQTQLSIRRSANLIRSGETIVIPRKSIQAVEVDRYSAMVSFVGLDYVRVTYLSDGQTRQVCFTPSSGTWASIAAVNQCVAEWADAIRVVKDGRVPVTPAVVAPSVAPSPDSSVGRKMDAFKILLAIVIAVLLVPAFYFFFNASIRNPIVAFVVAIPFLIHASVLSWRRVRTSHLVVAWLTAAAYVVYGYWEQHVNLVYPDWNIRIDLLPVLVVLYAFTLTSICGLLFPQLSNSRAAARALEDAPRRRTNRSLLARIVVVAVGLVIVFIVAAELIRIRNIQETIEIEIRHVEIANGHLAIDYSVQNIRGWNVWLTQKNAQLTSSDSPILRDPDRIVVDRFQAKLVGNGRAQVPLEYLPTTEEGGAKSLSAIWTTEAPTLSMTSDPESGALKLNFKTESDMRFWVLLMVLPEGHSPDSLPTNQATGSVGLTISLPTIQPKAKLPPDTANSSNSGRIDSQPIIMQLDENEKFVRGFRVKTETRIRQRVGEDFGLPEIERQIKTSFAIDERGRIRSEQTGGVPGQIGTTEVRQQHEVAVYDGLLLRLLKGTANEPANWGYHGRDKYRMPREVDPRNYLLEHNNEPLRQQVSGGKYEVIAKEPFQGREVFVLQTASTMREADKTSYRGRILLDPALGYAAVYRVSQIRFDDLGPEWHDFVRSELSDYKQTIGGIWVPGQATYTSFLVNRDVVKAKLPIESRLQQEIRFLDWELNPEFTDDDFTLTFPDGIFVMDESKTPESANP